MADYIDREELLKALKKEFRQNDYIKHDSYFEFKNIVETAPTVDTERHGHWIIKNTLLRGGEFVCSECGSIDRDIGIPKFCRICGAKMDEVTE